MRKREPTPEEDPMRSFKRRLVKVSVGLKGSHDKQSLLRPEPRLDVTSILLVI
jgi:hypothetical protein